VNPGEQGRVAHAIRLESRQRFTMRRIESTHGEAGGVSNARMESAILKVLGNQRLGSLEGLVDQFVGKGLGEVINSWISPLENQPVSVAQIRRVLGNETIAEIAWQARMSKKEASTQIAVLLPQLVDRLTPGGRIDPGQNLLEGMNSLVGSMNKALV